jgi:hypothetical protein
MAQDFATLNQVCRVLGEERPPSIHRLAAALELLLGPRPGQAPPEILDETEVVSLVGLFSGRRQERGEIVTRLERLYDRAYILAALSPTPQSAAPETTLEVTLEVIRTDPDLPPASRQTARAAIFRSLVREVESQFDPPGRPIGLVVVSGAQTIRSDQLEHLLRAAEQRQTRIVYLFEQLDANAARVLGRGGARTGFMRLSNAAEARAATDFIGQAHKWEASQFTVGVSETTTEAMGISEQLTESDFILGRFLPRQARSRGWTESVSRGVTESESLGYQRVYETVVEPAVIQGLPQTGLILVDVQSNGQRKVRNLDVNPVIACLERVVR